MIPHVTGAAHQTAVPAHVNMHIRRQSHVRCSLGQLGRRLPCRPLQPHTRHGLHMMRRRRLLIVAAAPEGGWLSQWLQGFMPGNKGKTAAEDAAKPPAVEEPRSPGVYRNLLTYAVAADQVERAYLLV